MPSAPLTLPPYLKQTADGVTLALKIQPRASSNAIVGELGSELRIRLTAPPVDSAANLALIEFLAGIFDCPRSHISLLRGRTSRHKTLLLRGFTTAAALRRLGPVST
jgi:uncharacterized protein